MRTCSYASQGTQRGAETSRKSRYKNKTTWVWVIIHTKPVVGTHRVAARIKINFIMFTDMLINRTHLVLLGGYSLMMNF